MKALIHFKSMAETCCVTSQPQLRALGSGYRVQEYYDLKKNWRKVKRHIGHPDVEAILVRDFNR